MEGVLMININNINDERISLYKSLRKTPAIHTDKKVFVAEGDISVLKLLESELQIENIFCTKNYYEKYQDLINKRIKPDDQLLASKDIMDQIVGFRLHKGIMAIAKQPDNKSIPELKTPIVILNGIVNSENVGAIVRNCVAFGIKSLIVDKQTSSPYLRRAVRCSMGAVFYTDIHFSENLIESIYELKSLGFSIIAAENTPKAIKLDEHTFQKDNAFIFGSEGNGIDGEILDLTDCILRIPITDTIASINVAASSAIFFYNISSKK
jgi:tRNA G18 (ribose-2'-O)-methylase SpoU